MKSIVLATAALLITHLVAALACQAQELPPRGMIYPCPNPDYELPSWLDSCSPTSTIRGWLFRRYAGSVEMETKTYYPPSYYGRYIYRGWQPDWSNPSPYNRRKIPAVEPWPAGQGGYEHDQPGAAPLPLDTDDILERVPPEATVAPSQRQPPVMPELQLP